MIDRETAKEVIRLRKMRDFVWNCIHKPLLLFYFLFTIIYILINKI